MKIIHTSDWHLGQSFHGFDRRYFEYRKFFEQLFDTIEKDKADALLISGDIFHNYNPSNEDEKLLSEFLTEAVRRFPHLQIVATSGNHDGASKLDAVAGYCDLCDRITVTGSLPVAVENKDGSLIKTLKTEDLIVPLHNADGSLGAYVIAMPFIKWPETLTNLEVLEKQNFSEFENYINALYEKALDEISRVNTDNLPVIAMGHFALSSKNQESYKNCNGEKFNPKVIGGESCIHVPFLKKVAYGALGHIHTPMKVMDNTCYCGSPLAVNFGENFVHHLIEVSFENGAEALIKEVELHNPVKLLRKDIKITDADTFTRELENFTNESGFSNTGEPKPLEERDFVQICIELPLEHKELLNQIRDAFKQFETEYCTHYRITPLKINISRNGVIQDNSFVGKTAKELDPMEVFTQFYRQNRDGSEPDEKMMTLVSSYFEKVRAQMANGEQD